MSQFKRGKIGNLEKLDFPNVGRMDQQQIVEMFDNIFNQKTAKQRIVGNVNSMMKNEESMESNTIPGNLLGFNRVGKSLNQQKKARKREAKKFMKFNCTHDNCE